MHSRSCPEVLNYAGQYIQGVPKSVYPSLNDNFWLLENKFQILTFSLWESDISKSGYSLFRQTWYFQPGTKMDVMMILYSFSYFTMLLSTSCMASPFYWCFYFIAQVFPWFFPYPAWCLFFFARTIQCNTCRSNHAHLRCINKSNYNHHIWSCSTCPKPPDL